MPETIYEKSEKISDFFNPLLVREIRQSLRSNVFSIAIIATSLLCFIALVCGILAQAVSHSPEQVKAGSNVFLVIYCFIWFITCLFLPISAANRFRTERESGEYELFSITGIPIRKIIFGKIQSSLAQGILIIAVAAPFMMTCYMLRGISALDIFIQILMLTAISITLIQGGILLGCLKMSKAFFSIVQIGFVLGQFYCSGIFFFMYQYKGSGLLRGHSGMGTGLFAFFLTIVLCYIFILSYLCSQMLLELPNRNRAFKIRIFLFLLVTLLPLIFMIPDIGLDINEASNFYRLMILPPLAITTVLILVPLAPAPIAVQKRWDKSRFSIFRPLLYPGRGSLLIWYSLMMGIVLIWEMYVPNSSSHYSMEDNCVLTTFLSGLMICCLIGNIFRLIWKNAPALLLSLIGCAIPSLFAVLLLFAGEEEIALLLCPVTYIFGVMENHMKDLALGIQIGLWIFLFIHGIVCYWKQRNLEKSNG